MTSEDVVSLSNLLDDFAGRARLVRESLSTHELTLLCADLNSAARWWWGQCSQMATPEMLRVEQVTLNQYGGITVFPTKPGRDTVWGVWSQDPLGNAKAHPLEAWVGSEVYPEDSGVRIKGGKQGDQVWVVWRQRVPHWQVTAVFTDEGDPDELFVDGTVLWNLADLTVVPAGPDGVIPQGHLYLAVIEEAAPKNFGQPTEIGRWKRIDLPAALMEVILIRANMERMRLGSKVPEAASREEAALDEAVADVWLRAEGVPFSRPWLRYSLL